MDQLLDRLTNLGTYASLLAAAAAVLAFIATSWFSFRAKLSSAVDPQARLEDQARIDEVRDFLKQQGRVARWAGRTNSMLVFGQVVIGGVLATSFAQSQLDSRIVGLFGVLVLVSSLMHQQFRPDLRFRNARRRIARLQHLLRTAEDGVFEIQKASITAPAIEELRRYVTEHLSRIEETEVEELPGERRVDVAPPDLGDRGRLPGVVEPTHDITADNATPTPPGRTG